MSESNSIFANLRPSEHPVPSRRARCWGGGSAGFLSLRAADTGSGPSLSRPVHCGVLTQIPGFYLPDANRISPSQVAIIKNVPRS